jgi:putative tributyrin esterase
MAFLQLHWFSQVLRKQTTTWVLLPETGDGPFATFYLLHGLSDNQNAWVRHTRINDYAAPLPLIVVMPDGGRGFYTNQTSGPQWATHIAEELPAFIERAFPARKMRQGRCIGGLSMGGYGAMRLALGYPDRYISATSHSGALMGPDLERGVISPDEFHQMVGAGYKNSPHDLAVLAKRAARAKNLPKIRLDCGTEDVLLEDNRKFHQTLQKLKVEHEYQEFPGNHNWDYWNTHITDALAFHCKAMGIALPKGLSWGTPAEKPEIRNQKPE